MNARAIKHVCIVIALLTTASGAHVAFSMGPRPPVVGSPAAEFSLTDLNGQRQSLSQYRGNIVLLNFWATWCKPCIREMPAMQAGYDKLRHEGFVVMAINELEDEEKVRQHIHRHGHTFPVLLDGKNRVANMYGVYGLPVSVFIDANGRVQDYIKGGLLTEQKIYEIVARLQRESDVRSASRH